jgi:hypothetical protein
VRERVGNASCLEGRRGPQICLHGGGKARGLTADAPVMCICCRPAKVATPMNQIIVAAIDARFDR